MRSFLIHHRKQLFAFSSIVAMFGVTMLVAGCAAPTWLGDASQVIGLVGAAIASIGSFVAGLTGNAALAAALAVVGAWVTKVQTGIADLTELIQQYQSAPNSTLLQKIEAALADLQANVAQDFSNLGLPSEILTIISGIAGLALGLLTQWSALFNNVAAAKTADEYRVASHALAHAVKNLSQSMAVFKAQVNAVLELKTGDAATDAALAKVPRLQ